MSETDEMIPERLRRVLAEIEGQSYLASSFGDDELPFGELVSQMHEFLTHHEAGLAYESMVATLQAKDFSLSGKAAVALIELALLFGYKTEDPADRCFDRRAVTE